MKNLFKGLFEYNFHFNQKLSNWIINNPDYRSDKSGKLLNHILNAHHIWNSRILENQIEYEVWSPQPDNLRNEINDRNLAETFFILNTVDLGKKITYRNSKGQYYENRIEDILFHIINHSTYHRGQIALDFRQNGVEPINSDYIYYKR